MSVFRHVSTVTRPSCRLPLLAAVFVAGMACASVHAATLGHSRLVSAVGEPLRITIPVTQLSASEAQSLQASPAPMSDWAQAGLTPPVDLATLHTRLDDGYAPGVRTLVVWSDHVFNQPIADLLLDIRTATGVQRYQVSLLAQGGSTAIQAPVAQAAPSVGGGSATNTAAMAQHKPILVRRGDTMFAIAGRHAVPGVTVYQMMIALQRANPHAFIQNNVNLVRAGEQLQMPDMAALTAISDREARRLFHEQVVAFEAYRRKGDVPQVSDAGPVVGQPTARLSEREPDVGSDDSISNVPKSRASGGDRLRLSSGQSPASTDGAVATAESRAGVSGGAASTDGNQAGMSGGAVATVENQADLSGGASSDPAGDAVANRSADQEGRVAGNGASQGVGQTSLDGAQRPAVVGQGQGTERPAVVGQGRGTEHAFADQSVQTDQASADGVAPVKGGGAGGASGAVSAAEGSASAGSIAPESATGASARLAENMASGVSKTAHAATADGASSQAGPSVDDGSRQDDETASRRAITDAQERVSLLEENVKKLNQAYQSQGEAAKDVVIEGAQGLRQSLTEVATAVTEATIGDEDFLDGIVDSESTEDAAPESAQSNVDVAKTKMDTVISWIQNNLIATILGVLAFVVLVIAWVLRRTNQAQSTSPDAVTPEMVKEKLEQINLDLNEPTVGDSGSSRS